MKKEACQNPASLFPIIVFTHTIKLHRTHARCYNDDDDANSLVSCQLSFFYSRKITINIE